MPSLYKGLNAREIRLLRLLPNQSRGTNIFCELRVFHLNTIEPYVALSYRWTTEEVSCPITVNGEEYPVRPNLFAYLELMRKEINEGWTFIDAISINQSDIHKRNSQVMLMGDVYSQAREVIGWLGTKGPYDEKLEATLCHALSSTEGIAALFDDTYSTSERTALQKFLLATFFQHDYWSRVWIVQETLLARALRLRHRTLSIDSKDFHSTLQYFEEMGYIERSMLPADRCEPLGYVRTLATLGPSMHGPGRSRKHSASNAFMLALSRLHIRDRRANPLSNQRSIVMPFRHAIMLSAAHESTETYDRIFGILGLTKSSLKVDYQMPVSELYTRALLEGLLDLSQGTFATWNAHSPRDPDNIASDISSLCLALQDSLGLSIWYPSVLATTQICLRLACSPSDEANVGMLMAMMTLNQRLTDYLLPKFFPEVLKPLVWLLVSLLSLPLCALVFFVVALCKRMNFRLPAGGSERPKTHTQLVQEAEAVYNEVVTQSKISHR